jgi:hypothetical protein
MDFDQATWRKSSWSSQQGSCVEIAIGPVDPGGTSQLIAVRDSKDATGPVLAFPVAGWRAFTDAIRDGGLGSQRPEMQ